MYVYVQLIIKNKCSQETALILKLAYVRNHLKIMNGDGNFSLGTYGWRSPALRHGSLWLTSNSVDFTHHAADVRT